MDLASARLLAVGRPDGLVRLHRRRLARGPGLAGRPAASGGRRRARRSAGGSSSTPPGGCALPPGVLEERARLARARHDRVLAGAGRRARRALAVQRRLAGGHGGHVRPGGRARAARRAGGRGASSARWRATACRSRGRSACASTTSARLDGRAPRGLARDLALSSWLSRRSLPPRRLRARGPAGGEGGHGQRRSCPRARWRARSARCSTASRRCGRRGCSTRCWSSTPPRPTGPRRWPPRAARAWCRRTRCCASTGPRGARATRCGAG